MATVLVETRISSVSLTRRLQPLATFELALEVLVSLFVPGVVCRFSHTWRA